MLPLTRPAALLAGAALLLAGCTDDDPTFQAPPGGGSPAATATSPADQAVSPTPGTTTADEPTPPAAGETAPVAAVRLTATLTGSAAIPEGDPDGTGRATLQLDPATGEVCFQIEVSNIAPATAAHIHQGSEGETGGIVVGLQAPDAEGTVDACVTADDPGIVQQIVDDPAGFYVQVHNDDYPPGAVRGQLEAA